MTDTCPATTDAEPRAATTDPPDPTGRSTLPGVLVVACVRDEEAYLADAVSSVLGQDYAGPMQLVLAVGPSNDATAEIAAALADDDPRVQLVDSPTGSRSIGLNAAISRADGAEVILRVDGHTVLPADYVQRCVATLRRTGAVGTGGLMRPVGTTTVQRAAARAMSHPAGIGSASFHVGGAEGPAETVYLGAFRRAAVEAVGGYDPSLVRAEDWDLCHRLRRAGGTLWFDPDLEVTYRPRRTVGAVAKQFWRTGMWRREVIRRDRSTASLRYLAPPAVVLATTASVVAALLGVVVGAPALLLAGSAVPMLYALGLLAASAHAAVRSPRLGLAEAAVLPLVMATMHLAWGAGFVRGLTDRAVVDHRA
ncbi:glycosyltransferase family 2 protein [Isoptericola aurantiacus]|uniref:glycosyltransferase family 2 protein n=1 Tax=Isoptericola aurantiacus TaxID=3377839 RepID=UPI00383BA340